MRMQVREFYQLVERLETYEGIIYYASDGEHVFSNSEMNKKEQFETYDAYMLVGDYQQKMYPSKVAKSHYYDYFTPTVDQLNSQTDAIYVAFTDAFLQKKYKNGKQIKQKPKGF